MVPSRVRFRCALIAGLAIHVRLARADDPREVFGLGPGPDRAAPSCGDGHAFDCATATDPLDDAVPFGLTTWLPGSYLRRLPVADATHEAVAAYALGAGGDGAGPGFGGATGLENRWTIDGAPADSLGTGAAGTRIPLAFLDGLWVSAGGFAARDRASTGGTIDARLRRGTADHEAIADAWTELSLAPRDAPTGSYAVRRGSVAPGPAASASLVATGPLGGAAWYAAGIAPRLAATDASWRAERLVDGSGPPGDPAVAPIDRTSERTIDYFVPVMARAGLDRGPHHVELTLIGEVQRGTQFLGNATLPAAGIDDRSDAGDAIATWRGTWAATHARVQLAWHHSAQIESAHDPAAAGVPQRLTGYIPATLADDPRLAAACSAASPGDPAPAIPSCPVLAGAFASGGAGLLHRAIGNRPSATVDLAQALGGHVVRTGATYEDSRLVTTSAFTGGELDRSEFPGELAQRRFYRGPCSDDPGAPCAAASASRLVYRAVYAAAYAEDTYTPVPGVSIDAGLRWELMWVGPALHFSRELAPRLGVSWDPLGGGRSRLWASVGRAFAMLPAGLGPTVIGRDQTVEDVAIGPAVARTHDAGAAAAVAPDVAPITQDEATLGAELALAGALRATLWGQGRWLRHGLATTAAGFDNPGRDGDMAATRQTEIVAGALELRQRDRMMIRAGVSWGRTAGTWTGPYDPRLGANLLQGMGWDAGAANLDGPLPSDAGGRAFIEAERLGTVGGVGVTIATRFTVGSGSPRSVVAAGERGVVELVPRGTAGRNPVIAQANLRLAARWRGITATLDLMNVFDRQTVTAIDETYSGDAVRPVSGGGYEDLVFLRTSAGRPARRETTFQLPTAYQPPLSISLGVHKAL